MAFRMLNPQQHKPYIEQGQTEDELPRFFECFACPMLRINIMKISTDEPRYRCQILDVENTQIEKENEEAINPLTRKPLKKCPNHNSEEE